MKAILISIQPQYVADILNHKKTLEIRKLFPKCDLPIDVYIYCTKGKPEIVWLDYCKDKIVDASDETINGKVVAKFTLNKVEEIRHLMCGNFFHFDSCLTTNQINDYLGSRGWGYAWHIDNLVPFDKPKEISEFNAYCKKSGMECLHCKHYWTDDSAGYSIPKCSGKPLTRAPQSWCYIEV